MGLDTNIAMSGQQVQLADPLTIYAKGAALQNSMQQNQLNRLTMEKHQQDMASERTLADLYRGAIGPDGKIDRTKILSGAADRGLGAKIPGLQKSFAEADKAQADVDQSRSVTGKNQHEVLLNGLKQVDGSLASLLAHPQLNENMVVSEVGRLVNLGAFKMQSEQAGKTPDEFARSLIATMPVGNPQALRSWLTEAGMRVMDASKRIELALPKYDEQDQGGQINEGTVDLMTGKRTAGGTTQKTETKDALLSAQTQRRGQDKVDSRMADANTIAKEAAQTQIVEGPSGYEAINKGTATSRPVIRDNGQPVLSKDAPAAKNARMAKSMTDIIPYARELLKSGPTASGLGAMTDKAAQVIGAPLKSSNVAGQLETLGGWMTSNVPRFEGPQGVQDVIIYQQMAGVVGDRTKSVQERLAAVDTVERLMGKYTGVPGTDGPMVVPPRPAVPVRGTAAAPHGSSPMRGGPTPAPAAPAAAPASIDSFFR